MNALAHNDRGKQLFPAMSRGCAAIAESVPVARRALIAVAEAAGVGDDQLEAVSLAVSEALTNAVVHAYPGRSGWIQVSAWTSGRELVIVIADEGHGLQAHSDSPGLGVGLALIAKLTDEFEILQPPAGGTQVKMRFRLSSRASPVKR
jgi:serine/threonine-protein kinase RsbW